MIVLTATILFLVYLNAPAVAVRMHGAPFLLGAAIPLALAIPVAHRVFVRGEEIRLPGLIVAAAFMLVVHAVSALLSVQPHASIGELQTWLLEGLLLALLVANAVRTRAELTTAIDAIVAAGALMGAVCVLQQLLGPEDHGFFGLGQLDAAISDESGRVQRRLAGPIGETNRFAQIMAVLIPVAAGGAVAYRGLRSAAHLVAMVLIAAGVALSYSRGAIVGLALAVPFALAFRLLAVRQLVLAVVAAIGLVVAIPQLGERVASIGEVALQSVGLRGGGLRNSDGAARGRVTEMKSAALVFVEHPILGAGPGLAPYYYDVNAGLIGGKVRQGERRSHNLFLQLAAETGIVGLGAFLLVIALAFQGLDRARRRLEAQDRVLWSIACGLEIALVVSLATSLFLHAAYIRYFWVLLGLAASASVQDGAPALVRLLARMLHETADRIRAGA